MENEKMLWDDNGSGMQPQHHSGKPQGTPPTRARWWIVGCAGVVVVAIAIAIVKSLGG